MDRGSLYISITRKINLGNYETCEISLSARDIPYDATEQDIEDLINSQGEKIMINMMTEIDKRILALRSMTKLERELSEQP